MWNEKYPLHEFQKRGVEFLERGKAVLIGDSMGLGKTAQALAFADRHGLNTLIVVPAGLRYNWENEIKKFIVKSKARFTIASYNDLFKVPQGYFNQFQYVVSEESHYLCNLEAQRTAVFHSHFRDFKGAFVGLSGTPIKNRVAEFYSLLLLPSLHPSTTNGIKVHHKYPTIESFAMRFSYLQQYEVPVTTRDGREFNMPVEKYTGARNIPELKEILKGKYIRRLAENVLELPPVVEKEVMYGNKNQLKIDLLMQEEFEDEAPIQSAKAQSAAMKAKNFTAGYVKDLLAETNAVVVFTCHIEAAKTLYTELFKKKVKVRVITGETPPHIRQSHVDALQAGKVEVLVATIGAAAEGYTMTKANHLVFNDIDWVPAKNMQARKRIDRMGQTRTCFIHYILGSDIDKKIVKTLREKEKVLEQVL